MASYRPYPPPSSFGQNPIPPPPAQPAQPPSGQSQQRGGGGGGGGGGGSQYNNQNWGGYSGDGSVPPAPSSSYPQNYNQGHQSSTYHQQHYGPPRSQHPPPPPPPHQSYPYAPQPPPPPPDSSYPPPPPPPASSQPPHPYYPTSQFSQGNQNQQSMQPPPPPSSPPPSSSIPPPPPPNSPPPPSAPQQKAEGTNMGAHERNKGVSKDPSYGRRERENSNHDKHQRHSGPPLPPKKANGPSGRMETEDEKRVRKKREFEKQRQDERHRHHLKESQNTILQKTQMLSTGKGHGSIVGSRMGERRSTPFLSGERIENRLKKPTTFLCKLKFRNELPDTSAQPKLMSLRKEKDHYTRYTITSLEKMYKPQLYVEPDLGIPLDLLDLSVYNPPSVRTHLALEDEELLRDDVLTTPVKKDGIKRKDRPTDKGVAWLVKTQYISPLSIESTKQSLTEKQAKDLREMKGGRNILANHNNRERQIKEIEASFEACKSRPVHATNKNLYPVEVLPLLPDFDRYDDPFVMVAFDSAPTADSETFKKLDPSIREAHESQAIMKSYMATGSDPTKPEKFLAYMVPSPDELSKDIYDEQEDVSFSWVREYHWDVRGDNVDDPTTYVVSFDDAEARYLPLPTKLVLRKKRAKEGRSNDEIEHFPAPARVTVRRRSTVATLEMKDPEVYSNSKRGSDNEDGLGRSHKHARHQDMDQYSGAEDDMSD